MDAMLSLYVELDEPTPWDATRYTEDILEPTVEMAKSDAVLASYEAESQLNYEAAGVWLLVAGGLDGR
jgi:hypothetical protein